MHYEINSAIIDTIKNAEGEVRGATLETDRKYIMKLGEEEGVKKTEEILKDMGVSFSYKEVKESEFYPIGVRILSLIAISQAFNLSPKEIKKMGFHAPRVSSVVKLFARYFLSVEAVFKKASSMWKEHYTIGRLEQVEIDNKKRYAIIRLHDINIHPVLCDYLAGYFVSLFKMAEGKDGIIKETECYFKGDKYHNFVIKW